MSALVLSLFPGIGLLDMAFEVEGYCVVRGPDLLWGGDVRRFEPPSGRFDGVIGGPPCQPFSRLAALVRANGYEVAPNLIPEYERIVALARPLWFLMENVEDAPIPQIDGYDVTSEVLDNRWLGEEQSRRRRFSFGSRGASTARFRLDREQVALENPRFAYAVTASGGAGRSGTPVARALQDGWTAEVTRLATTGEANACSILYAAAWRAARALGYRRIVTYTLGTEPGTSLRAAGWRCLGASGGGRGRARPGRGSIHIRRKKNSGGRPRCTR